MKTYKCISCHVGKGTTADRIRKHDISTAHSSSCVIYQRTAPSRRTGTPLSGINIERSPRLSVSSRPLRNITEQPKLAAKVVGSSKYQRGICAVCSCLASISVSGAAVSAPERGLSG